MNRLLSTPIEDKVDELKRLLTGQGWMQAKFIHEFSDRELRDIASHAGGQIISGNKGYCLLAEATADEVTHFAARLNAQRLEMKRRVDETLAAWLELHGPVQPWLFEEVGA